jgi:hypothetical protein
MTQKRILKIEMPVESFFVQKPMKSRLFNLAKQRHRVLLKLSQVEKKMSKKTKAGDE